MQSAKCQLVGVDGDDGWMDGWMDGDDDDKGAAANKLIRGRCLTSVTRIDLMKQRG